MLCAVIALAPMRAYADGLSVTGGSPRAIGRAGAATIGDDGGGALLINPAAIARRDALRAQLGVAVIDDKVDWHSDTSGAHDSTGQNGSSLAPLGAVIGSVGAWVIGVGVMTAGVVERQLAPPGDVRNGLNDRYDYRYAGIGGTYRRDTLALGVARRIGDTLALGLTLAASRIQITEQRRIWAGFGASQVIGAERSDVDLTLDARDPFTPSAMLGVLYAPEDTPIELGASFAWSAAARADGGVTAAGVMLGPRVEYTAPVTSALTVRQPLAIRAGGRYVGDRVVGELDGDLWIAPAGAESAAWAVGGVDIYDPTLTLMAQLARVPSRISQRSHVAVRTSVDVELIPGFLWATGGYAYANLGTEAARLSPSFADLGGQTLGLGLEATSGPLTVSLGWSRTWATATRAPSELRLDNPFGTGDGPVPSGKYDGSIDQIGLLLEAALAGSP